MSFYLLDFTLDEIDFNFDNIIIGKKIPIDDDSSKYYIYYQKNEDDIPKELYIKLPKIRCIYNLSNYKYNQLNIPIYPSWKKTVKFIQFMKEFETNINNCFLKKFNNIEYSSIIYKKNLLNFIKINVYDKIKVFQNNKLISINEFKINSELEIFIKLSYIWSKNNKIGLSSNLFQIKYFPSPDNLEIDKIINERNNEEIDIKKPLGFFPPSVQDLQNAINKIKK